MSEPEEKWRDILIDDRDLVPDTAGLPEYVINRPTITQDIVHMIMDSGLLIELVGERSKTRWDANMAKIEMLVEDDKRVIPGTVIIDYQDRERIALFARSIAGDISTRLPLPNITEGQNDL